MPAFSPHQILLPLEAPVEHWVRQLIDAFDDARRTSGFLPLAEVAVNACPGDPNILCLAAASAVLDERPERALGFLKRLSKRYVPMAAGYLLQALAWHQANKRVAARTLLNRHGLTQLPAALSAFPGGRERKLWLAGRPRRHHGGRRTACPLQCRRAAEAIEAAATGQDKIWRQARYNVCSETSGGAPAGGRSHRSISTAPNPNRHSFHR